MILNVDISGAWESEDIDLEDLYELDWVYSEEGMAEAIMLTVAKIALDHEVSFTNITPGYVEDDNGCELIITSNPGMCWVNEVAKFAWHVLAESHAYDRYKYFAYVDNEHWKYFDFDNMSKIDDYYLTTFDGDYEEYAKEYMDNTERGIPEHLESYFDYSAYGESLLEDENVIEWGGEKYIFSE